MEHSEDLVPEFKWNTGPNRVKVDDNLPAHERLFKVQEHYAKRQNAVRWEIMRRRIQAEDAVVEIAERKAKFRQNGKTLSKAELDEVIERHYSQAETQKKQREEAANAKAEQEATELAEARKN